MAIDSLAKRSSVANVGTVVYLTLPPADSSISQADRQHVAHHYTGILAIRATVISGRYKLRGTNNQKFELSGTSMTKFKLRGAAEDKFSLAGA